MNKVNPEHCGFGTSEKLQENLRDRLICGINNEKWQTRFLAEDSPDYKKIYDLVISLEAAEKGVKKLQDSTTQPQQDQKVHNMKGGGTMARRM